MVSIFTFLYLTVFCAHSMGGVALYGTPSSLAFLARQIIAWHGLQKYCGKTSSSSPLQTSTPKMCKSSVYSMHLYTGCCLPFALQSLLPQTLQCFNSCWWWCSMKNLQDFFNDIECCVFCWPKKVALCQYIHYCLSDLNQKSWSASCWPPDHFLPRVVSCLPVSGL